LDDHRRVGAALNACMRGRREGPGVPYRTIIIGAGMAGILAGVKLLEKGDDDFIIFEKGDSVGGTWRENRYPGLTCDVPAHAYTYSFAPNPDWSAFYAGGPEIKAYFEAVVRSHGLERFIRFNSEAARCVYDDAARRWRVTLADGGCADGQVLIAASGVLHHPNIPALPGLESFRGRAFHSARWDDAADLDGARVGVIGNGSTGVQLVGALSTRSAKVVHFQRSPQWIMPVPYFTYTDEQRRAFRQNPALIDDIRYGEDYWSGIRRFNKALVDVNSPEMAEIEAIVLRNLEDSVKDPALREKLRPNYRAGCKRLIYSWNYYEAVQRPTVVVERGGVDEVTPEGIRTRDGSFHPLDVIVLATGFRADRFIRPTVVLGRGGVSLDDVWALRPHAYMAVTIPDFPNLFLLNGPTGPVGNFSLIDIAERQWGYIEPLLELLRSGEYAEISASQAAMADYEERRIAAAKTTIFGSGCTSWYLDAEGVPASWPWSYEAFAEAMAAPKLADFDLRRTPARAPTPA
jgi:cation diffusion facilitator CzcD-associated flavoprotein CzcO